MMTYKVFQVIDIENAAVTAMIGDWPSTSKLIVVELHTSLILEYTH